MPLAELYVQGRADEETAVRCSFLFYSFTAIYPSTVLMQSVIISFTALKSALLLKQSLIVRQHGSELQLVFEKKLIVIVVVLSNTFHTNLKLSVSLCRRSSKSAG